MLVSTIYRLSGSRTLRSVVVLLVVLSFSSLASASILQTSTGANPEDVFALLNEGSAASGAAEQQNHNPQGPANSPTESKDEAAVLGHLVEGHGPGGTSTTTSPSSNSLSAGGAMAFMAAEALSLDDDCLASRLAISRCFLPATPVGAGLFRPPRA